ncbi:hypothetical protein PTI45_04493 [Paenibacillus nuruki]|uniref:Uncharacterized protein n=1 Tax=Paenibacillus nuruki TaxID=1886670 RepID=A0A1E3KXW0_9BACL|nr:hypothetical protein [Paenibacillus nuruki]ODP26151.1 hypothetical protein PTI45_04493 [Paenibacillus nuruki]
MNPVFFVLVLVGILLIWLVIRQIMKKKYGEAFVSFMLGIAILFQVYAYSQMNPHLTKISFILLIIALLSRFIEGIIHILKRRRQAS